MDRTTKLSVRLPQSTARPLAYLKCSFLHATQDAGFLFCCVRRVQQCQRRWRCAQLDRQLRHRRKSFGVTEDASMANSRIHHCVMHPSLLLPTSTFLVPRSCVHYVSGLSYHLIPRGHVLRKHRRGGQVVCMRMFTKVTVGK